MRPAARNWLRWLAGLAIAAASLWFMASELSLSFERLGAELARIPFWSLALSCALFAASVLAETFIWHRLLKTIPGEQKLPLLEAFAVLNVTAVGKYVPGKVWGYAWQMYLLDRRGVSARASLRTNAVAVLAACTAGAIVGGAGAAFGRLGKALVLLSIAAGLALLALVPLHERLGVVGWLGRRLRVDLGYAGVRSRHWLLAVAGYLGVWIVYAAGGVVLAAALEHGLGPATSAAVVAGMSLSWLVGMTVFLAPAGLGVREAAMALILPGQLRLVLPIATRLLLILVDLVLEAAALAVLWSRRRESGAGAASPADQSAAESRR